MLPTLATLPDSLLETVGGGYSDADFGRCGPGSSWKFLGNVYTPQCAAHDAAVRSQLEHGSSQLMAQLRALPLLPAAIGSYVKARVTGH